MYSADADILFFYIFILFFCLRFCLVDLHPSASVKKN